MNTGTVNISTGKMKYFRFGSGKKQMVILPGFGINGVSGVADAVASSFAMFTDDYTIYVIDRRTEVPEHYSIRDMAKDTEEAFDSLGIKDAYIYSVSMGGMTAQVLASKRPDLVKKLMLGSTASYIDDDAAAVLSRWIAFLEKKEYNSFFSEFIKDVYTPEFSAAYGEMIIKMCGTPSEDDLIYLKAVKDGDGWFSAVGDLEKIKADVLVVGAEGDRIFKEENFRITAEKTGGSLYIYEGMSHAVYDEAPDFRERAKTFFER